MSKSNTEYRVDYRLNIDGDEYEPGDPISLSDEDAKPLLATKPPVISKPGKKDESPSGDNVVKLNGGEPNQLNPNRKPAPQDQAERINQIKAAIIGLDKKVEANWTKDNLPDANALTERLGWKVKAEERDQAWQELQDSKGE